MKNPLNCKTERIAKVSRSGGLRTTVLRRSVAGSLLGICLLWPLPVHSQILPTRPVIVQHPKDHTVEPGEDLTLEVKAESFLEIFYQWQRDGADIDGATESTLTLSNIQLDTVGEYRVLVYNTVSLTRPS